MIKRVMSAAMVLLMLFSLTACKDEVKEYREKLTIISNEVEKMDEEVQAAIADLQTAMSDQDSTAYAEKVQQLREYCDKLKEKYNAIAQTPAPQQYEQEQKLLKQYADEMGKMLDASMEIYEMAQKTISGSISEDDLTRLSELTQEVESYMESTTNFDETLNKILGYTEE